MDAWDNQTRVRHCGLLCICPFRVDLMIWRRQHYETGGWLIWVPIQAVILPRSLMDTWGVIRCSLLKGMSALLTSKRAQFKSERWIQCVWVRLRRHRASELEGVGICAPCRCCQCKTRAKCVLIIKTSSDFLDLYFIIF